MLTAIVVGAEVNSLFVQIGQQLVCNFGESDLRVAHGRSAVTINRTEISLSIHQQVSERKILSHSHNGVVDRLVPVRMIFTNHVSHDTSRLLIGTIPVVVQLMHGEKNSPVHRFEPVSRIRKRATYDYAHCIVEVAPAHFLFKTNRQGFFGELCHEKPGWSIEIEEKNPLMLRLEFKAADLWLRRNRF